MTTSSYLQNLMASRTESSGEMFDEYSAVVYGAQRIRATKALSEAGVPESVAVNLARMDLDDDQLEAVVEEMGGQEFGRQGWGMSDILSDLLSREPTTVPVESLATFQRNLIDQGYMPPDTAADGVWTPSWANAFRRADRDAYDRVREGHHVLAAPVEAGIRFIGQTIPSNVFQGIVGAARGIVEQSAETAERGGALGAGVAGAAIGTAIAPGAGTLIGGAVGAIAGFAADFFGDDEGEDDQSGAERFFDALSPFEEYARQGPKAFFEDLGFVLSAAAIVRGAAMAAGAAGAGAKQMALHGAMTKMKTSPAEAGWATKLLGFAMKPVAPNAAKTWVDWAAREGLKAQMSRPLFATVQGMYTGLSAGQLGARYAGGLGSGADQTTIEKAIDTAPELSSWVDNTLGLVLYPSRFFPTTKAGSIGKSLQWAMGDVNLQPYVHVAQKARKDGSFPSLAESKGMALSALGRDPLEQAKSDAFLRLSYGISRRAGEMLHEKGRIGDEINIEKLWTSARSRIVRDLKKQGESGGSPLAHELASYSYAEPTGYMGFLEGLDAKGSGIERMKNFIDVQFEAQRIAREANEGLTSVEVLGGPVRRAVDFDVAAARHEATLLKQKVVELRRKAKRNTDPNVTVQLHAEANEIEGSIARLKETLKSQAPIKGKRGLTLVPVRLHDPASGVMGYATRQELEQLAKDYERLAGDYRFAFKNFNEMPTAETQMAVEQADAALFPFVSDLEQRGLITHKLAESARSQEPPKSVAEHLRKRSKHHGRDVAVSEDIRTSFEMRGYKLVSSGEDMLFMNDLDTTMELSGVGDYTRRAAFFETIGLSPFQHSNDSLFALRQAHTQGELDTLMQSEGMKMTGKQVLKRINDFLVEKNNGKGTQGVLAWTLKEGDDPLWKRVSLYKIDARELRPGDIYKALDLDGAPSHVDPLDLAGKVKGALMRGGSLGGEVSMRHPLDSARMLGKALRINGLPGFSDFIRTAHIENPTRAGAIAGAVGGAAVGASDGEGVAGAIEGAAVGAVALGTGGRIGKKQVLKYGDLPNRLHNANMALRYALSPVFDAGRYVEQNTLGFMKAGLPPIFAPKRYITSREWKSVGKFSGRNITGDDAWTEAIQYWDELNGGNVLKVVDDIDRRMSQKGMLGFTPRYHEAAQAYLLKQRGWADDKIKETVAEIGRYGLGRTGAEKSVNFVFFPFSFSKKYLTSLGDFILQAPARNLLIYEGIRRYHESSLDERFGDFMEKHVPLAKQLSKINNLSYGLSPGRFFLEGFGDNRSKLGKTMHAISALFVPSGAATPVAQAAGGTGDVLANLFVPVVVTDDTDINSLDDVINRYVPAMRDVDAFFESLGEQKIALTEGAAPFWQHREYVDGKRAIKEKWEPIALSLGYSSVDSFLASEVGQQFIKPAVDAEEFELANQLPTGFKMAQEFTNTYELNLKALNDIANKPDRSEAEDLILEIAEMENTWKAIGASFGMPWAEVQKFATSSLRRTVAEAKVSDKARLEELWNRLFAYAYGPIRRVA